MKLPSRLLTLLLLLAALPLLLYTTLKTQNPLHDIWTQYRIPDFIVHTFHPPPSSSSPNNSAPPDTSDPNLTKIIVMAKTHAEDTSWVSRELYSWQNAIYSVDTPPSHPHSQSNPSNPSNPSPNLNNPNLSPNTPPITVEQEYPTPLNKGHEAMAYLTYILTTYPSFPSIITFLHPHRSGFFSAWHTDTPLHSNPAALTALNLTHVLNQGYVNLRCNHSPGCRPQDREHNEHVTKEVWEEVWRGTSSERWAYPGGEGQGGVGQACCAQFAVSGERVLRRPRGDYERLREWLVGTELSDRRSGRVMEFLWQVIFSDGGEDGEGGGVGVFCPEEKQCYCDVYGRC